MKYRVAGGFWRRGSETPSAVKWEDRIIEIREGSWSYVAGPIGRAPGMFYDMLHKFNDGQCVCVCLALSSLQN